MTDATFILLAATVALTLVFDFINGFHDTANSIATVVSTRALTPLVAVVYAGILNFVGAMMGTEVAATIGKGLVDKEVITLHTVLCTVLAAIVWNLITWWKGLPTSSSHAIAGSLLGAAFFSASSGDGIHWDTVVKKILIPMAASPVLGIAIGFTVMLALTWLLYRFNPGFVNRLFGKMQIVSAGFMAVNHGLNDAQKSMGIIALAIVLASAPGTEFVVPLWVKISCSVAMGVGTMMGGWRIIRTLGTKMIKLQPVQGFAAETTASIIIGGASHFGIPVSTTQVITTSIMGVGTTQRLSAVRWGVVGKIVWAWILTIPLTFLLAGAFMTAYKALFFSN